MNFATALMAFYSSDEDASDYGSYSSYESDEEVNQTPIESYRRRHQPSNFDHGVPVDYENNFQDLDDDILGSEEGSDEETGLFEAGTSRRRCGRRNNRRGDERSEVGGAKKDEEAVQMFFDFRLGRNAWPSTVEVVDPKRAQDLLAKAKEAARAQVLREKEREEGKQGAAARQTSVTFQHTGDYPVARGDDDQGGEAEGLTTASEHVKFETLSDGSTALSLQPGERLRLNLEGLLRGGDARKKEREQEAKRIRRQRERRLEHGEGSGAYRSSAAMFCANTSSANVFEIV